MPSRRPHTKSRLGCLTCKQRKVRCDQTRPICENCTRLEKACAYPDVVIPPTTRHPARTGSTSKAPEPDATIPHSTITDESAHDLELMHHWSSQTSLTMTDDPKQRHIWQYVVPKHALSHRFLLHGILAHAAVHRSQDFPPEQRSYYVELAKKHHSQALTRYISCLQTITRENCHALFAFSNLVGPLSYGLLQITYDVEEPRDFIKGITDTFDLLKGAVFIANQSHVWLKVGELSPMMDLETPGSTTTVPPTAWGLYSALETLLGQVQSIAYAESADGSSPEASSTTEANKAYASSIQSLLPALPGPDGSPPKLSTVLAWPVTVDQSYIALLKSQDPTSLVILNHYGTALHCLKDVWWLRSVGSKLHRAIAATIEAEWRPYLTMSSWNIAKRSLMQPLSSGNPAIANLQ